MPDGTRGLLWPLIVLFVVTLFGGSIGMILSQGDEPWFDENVARFLLLSAGALAILMYFPRIVVALKVDNLAGLDTRTAEIRQVLLGAHGNQDQLAALAGTVGTLQADVATLSTNTGNLQTTLNNLQTALQPVPANVTTLQTGVTALTGRTDVAADVAAIRTSVTAIEAKVAKLP